MTLDLEPRRSLAVVDVPERCGNAPRKAVVRDFAIALASKNVSEVTGLLKPDVEWTVNGGQTLSGTTEVGEWIAAQADARELKINTVITHGTECGVDGALTLVDGTTVAFAHILRFTGGSKTARISEVRSYVVPH